MDRSEARREYVELQEYSAVRSKELAPLLKPYVDATDKYGELICHVTLILGKNSPASKLDEATRDLMADIFDYLFEARSLISKGKTNVAYPLARRAYESLSLLVASHMDEKLSIRWLAGEQISNGEVRKVLGTPRWVSPKKKPRLCTNSSARHPILIAIWWLIDIWVMGTNLFWDRSACQAL